MFLDAIKIGALSFSARIYPRDFSFQLRRVSRTYIPGDADLIMEYAGQGAKHVKGVAPFWDNSLTSDRPANDAWHMLRCFHNTMLDASKP